MNVNVTFRHLEPSDSLKSFAREKVERVKKFLDQASEADVVLSIEKHLHHADILVHSGPFFIRGRDKSDDMYASIGLAIDKVERQIRRYKDRLRTHKTRGGQETAALRVRQDIIDADAPEAEDGAEMAVAAAEPARVVKTNELLAPRMSVDEAIMRLNLIDEDLLVFTNTATNHVAVLHRRRDDARSYGLIDARPAS